MEFSPFPHPKTRTLRRRVERRPPVLGFVLHQLDISFRLSYDLIRTINGLIQDLGRDSFKFLSQSFRG